MPTSLAVFILNSQSQKIIGSVGQQLWCHFLNCGRTRLSVLSCLSPSLGCSTSPWVPSEPLLDKTHYPSLLLFRKLIIPSITSGLSDNRMNMPSHRLIRSLCLESVGGHNSSPRHYISCNYLSNMTSLVWHLILLFIIIDSLFGGCRLISCDNASANPLWQCSSVASATCPCYIWVCSDLYLNKKCWVLYLGWCPAHEVLIKQCISNLKLKSGTTKSLMLMLTLAMFCWVAIQPVMD